MVKADADTGWSTTATTGAFSAALIVLAHAGIPVGRILGAYGGIFVAGSIRARGGHATLRLD